MAKIYRLAFGFYVSIGNVSVALADSALEWQDAVNSCFAKINAVLGGVLFWSDHPLRLPLILLVMVGGGIFFTIRYRFVNVRLFRHAWKVIRGHYDRPEDRGEITHFQALTSALSATVGLGNIAGVAVAISLGGPGAVFWLWVVAFFGMSMKFSSCTLAQLHRRVHADGSVLGGPMVYLEEAFSQQHPGVAWIGKIMAVVFAVLTIFASLGGGNLFQGNQAFELLVVQFPSLAGHNWLAGLVLSLLVGTVVIGGIKRIGDVTSKLVPAMCAFYCLGCLAIIVGHFSLVPGLLAKIFIEAFRPDALWAGGFIGVLTQGVRRASFSNEAGLGSAAIAHAAAKTDKPVREGVVAMLGPFIDTHLVCTMTSLAILITGVHLDPGLAGKGAAITSAAFATLGSLMPMLLTFAAVIFAYSTMISWGYYGERGAEYLFGRRMIMPFRFMFVGVVVLGPVLSLRNVIEFADIMLLSMAFPNIVGMMFLTGQSKKMLCSYVVEYRTGRMRTVTK